MSRQRAFDQTTVVDQALLVFWRSGYEGCSIRELVTATGLKPQSLYNTFGDKQGLFLAVLTRYRALVDAALVPIDRPEARLADLRLYMEQVLELQRAQGCGGCLLVKTAFGPEVQDSQIRETVEEGAAAVRSCFARLVQRSVRAGELPPGTDARSCASYLFSVLNGLSALAVTGGTPAQIRDVLSRTFLAIGQRPTKPRRR